ncbi:MAG: hypothetical protein Q4E70_00755 [Candidatus Saccharibacteria bacterium]|nr:hypothetical protein [Candidatus Saccharibacteria bacterium]
MVKKTDIEETPVLLKAIAIAAPIIVGVLAILIIMFSTFKALSNYDPEELSALPTPEVSEGMRGEMGIDKNINETTIDNYLGRSDSVYRDMRMLVDEADYSKIDGDSYLSGIVNGFEVVPLPYLIYPEGLPEEVGESYNGKTLFSKDSDGKYVANYIESEQILEDLFPKDKNIFLMCGGGGYAGMTKKLLVSLGWDENKIYNVGGYWYYEGENKTSIKMTIDGTETYAFWRLDYHTIDFNELHKK